MKSTLIGVVAALALSTLSVAYADDTSVSVSAARTQHYQMQAEEFSPYSNTYKLSNGQKIAFNNEQNRLYATLGTGRPLRIYATSASSFVTESGVRFDFRDEGSNVAITDFQKLPRARNVPASGMMVAHR